MKGSRFLSAVLGWDPRPSIEQVVVWLAAVVPVTIVFFLPGRRPNDTAPSPTGASAVEPARPERPPTLPSRIGEPDRAH